MVSYEWPAQSYVHGSYIQSTVADYYLDRLNIKPTDRVLDVGCGDGSFSTKILQRLPKGSMVGIDRSENMLALAREKSAQYPQWSVELFDVLDIHYKEEFDYVVSFWCLQWCPDLHKALNNIYGALKKGGQFLILLPKGDDPFIGTYETVKLSGKFPILENFVPLMNYKKIHELPQIISQIPFNKVHIETPKQSMVLPSLDVFRKFVNGIAFYSTQVPEAQIPLINEAMVNAFNIECQKKYRGEYRFDFSIYLLSGEK